MEFINTYSELFLFHPGQRSSTSGGNPTVDLKCRFLIPRHGAKPRMSCLLDTPPNIWEMSRVTDHSSRLVFLHFLLLPSSYLCITPYHIFLQHERVRLELELMCRLRNGLEKEGQALRAVGDCCCSDTTKSCPVFCDPMDCSTPSFPVHHYLTVCSHSCPLTWWWHQPSHPLLLLPSIFPRIRVFSNELALHIGWPKYWSFSFSINPSNEYSELISLG